MVWVWIRRVFPAVAAFLLIGVVPLFAATDYGTLKKYLSARMFSEAYLEMMRCELTNKTPDSKLTKLKKDLVAPTRKEATTRAKVKSDDAMLFTILADIDFQEGQVEAGIQKISRALENKPTDLTYYVFAKLLFSKGNLQQSFEQMEKALHLNPGSEVIFDDFQFLYQSRAYGITAAKRLTPDPGFLKRVTPVASKSGPPQPPDSPFENDPTQQPEPVPPPPDPEPEPDPLVNAQTPDQTGKKTGTLTSTKTGTKTATSTGLETGAPTGTATDIGFPTDTLAAAGTGTGDDMDFPIETGVDTGVSVSVPPTGTTTGKATGTGGATSSDPEQKKIQEAEYWLEQAKTKFNDGAWEDAESTLKKARTFMPDVVGGEELQGKIDGRRKLEADYKLAVSFYESEKYDNAREGIAKAFEADPKKFPEAPFYLGKIFILGADKDYKKARDYFDIFLKNPNANVELKRDIEWVVIGILTDDGEYEEAYKRFNDFVDREPDFAKNQQTYWKLKYRLWYRNYQTGIQIGLGLFIGAFILVFFLMLVPSFGIFLRDPLKRAQQLFEAQKYDQAVKVIEDSLKRKKHPIQVERQMHEVAVECHFLLKNYVKCQDHAKQLLTLFADNIVAWKYLTKAYLLTNDGSDDAITMYETMYKRDPENKDYLPILAKHYAQNKLYSVEAMEVMEAYFQIAPTARENILALADGFVQNKRMDEISIHILSEALKIKDQLPFRELLARAYSKVGKFVEASRECLAVLKANLNNMGIHVVYTSCMKKLNMLDEAVLQYEEFLRKNPGNPQLQSILTDLRKEVESTSGRGGGSLTSHVEGLSPFSDEMISDGLIDLPEMDIPGTSSGQDIEGFVEPMPDGFDPNAGQVPIPEFLKHDLAAEGKPAAPYVTSPTNPPGFNRPAPIDTETPNDSSAGVHDLPMMDPFNAHETEPASHETAPAATSKSGGGKTKDASTDDDLEALLPPRKPDAPPKPELKRSLRPEEDASGRSGSGSSSGLKVSSFAGKVSPPRSSIPVRKTTVTPPPEDTASVLDNIGMEPPPEVPPEPPVSKGSRPPSPSSSDAPPPATDTPSESSSGGSSGGLDLNEIRKKLSSKKYDEVVNLLAPQFAVSRRKDIGLLLADGYLHQKKPELAFEILETLDFDREMMPDEIKDILYRVAVSLEDGKRIPEALRLYDIICNVDINYLDAFDRSDRLYAAQPKKKK